MQGIRRQEFPRAVRQRVFEDTMLVYDHDAVITFALKAERVIIVLCQSNCGYANGITMCHMHGHAPATGCHGDLVARRRRKYDEKLKKE